MWLGSFLGASASRVSMYLVYYVETCILHDLKVCNKITRCKFSTVVVCTAVAICKSNIFIPKRIYNRHKMQRMCTNLLNSYRLKYQIIEIAWFVVKERNIVHTSRLFRIKWIRIITFLTPHLPNSWDLCFWFWHYNKLKVSLNFVYTRFVFVCIRLCQSYI